MLSYAQLAAVWWKLRIAKTRAHVLIVKQGFWLQDLPDGADVSARIAAISMHIRHLIPDRHGIGYLL